MAAAARREAVAAAPVILRPQPGPQESFLASAADIAIYGGAAGGGKSFALLLEPLRHVHNPGFGGVIFRKTTKQVRNEGGLWDEATGLYPQLGAALREQNLDCTFPAGSRLSFSYLEHEADKLQWQGAQICYLGFDEITHFSASQFWYMLSRNRSACGVRPYVRGTCNPDADSWLVAGLEEGDMDSGVINWWIDRESGFPIAERAGVLRWFYRVEGRLHWYDTSVEAMAANPTLAAIAPPKSLTFIPSKVQDNPILLAKDPGYLGNLLALPLVERERLLNGNWRVRPAAGKVCNRSWFEIVDAAPAEGSVIRYWDKAGTEGGGDRTAAVRMREHEGLYYIEDVVSVQEASRRRNQLMRQVAELDGRGVEVWTEQEPGSGGKESAEITISGLAGWSVYAELVTGAKVTRWGPFCAQAEAGNVKIVRGAWNREFLEVLHNADGIEGHRDDELDAAAGAFNKLVLDARPYLGWSR